MSKVNISYFNRPYDSCQKRRFEDDVVSLFTESDTFYDCDFVFHYGEGGFSCDFSLNANDTAFADSVMDQVDKIWEETYWQRRQEKESGVY